jgi:hypothetical protein
MSWQFTTPDNVLGPDPAEEGCEECGAPCRGTICRRCIAEHEADNDEP